LLTADDSLPPLTAHKRQDSIIHFMPIVSLKGSVQKYQNKKL
jgi:hypothetical protein